MTKRRRFTADSKAELCPLRESAPGHNRTFGDPILNVRYGTKSRSRRGQPEAKP